MRQIIILLIFSAIFCTSALGFAITNYSGYKVFQITPKSESHLRLIGELHDVPELDIWSSKKIIGASTVIMVPKAVESFFKQILDSNNLDYKIMIDDLQKIIDLERQEQFLSYQKQPLGISFTRYNRFNEINEYLLNLTKQYPEIASVINIGKTYEGRPLNVLKISTGGDDSKPAVFVDGGIHAREWIAPAQVLYIINQLLENQKENKDMIEQVDWYLLPVINPDGYEYTHTSNRLWRKTRSVNQGTSCMGVDANRNCDFHWKEAGASSNPCDEDYAGPKSFSESEAESLAQFGMKIKDQLKLYLSFHSPAEAILYPWCYTGDLPENADELQQLGLQVRDAFVDYKDYSVGSATQVLYKAAGCTQDWFKGVTNTPLSYTIELPGGGWTGFDLPPKDILPVVTDTYRGIRVLGEYVKNKFANQN